MEGKHVKWMIRGVVFERLVKTKLIRSMLLAAVESTGMKALGKPHIYDIHKTLKKQGIEPDPEEPEGVTGIVVLSTSHAAIHTWPHRGMAIFDLFSCRDFLNSSVERVIINHFEPEDFRAVDISHSLSGERRDQLRRAATEAHNSIVRWGGKENPLAVKLRNALKTHE